MGILESHLTQKKRQNSSLCVAKQSFSPCSGELLSLEGAADFVQRRQKHEEKRKAASFQRLFQSTLLSHAKCHWQTATLSFSRLWSACSLSHVFCSQTHCHRVTSPSFSHALLSHPPPQLRHSVALWFLTHGFPSMDYRGEGLIPRSPTGTHTSKAGMDLSQPSFTTLHPLLKIADVLFGFPVFCFVLLRVGWFFFAKGDHLIQPNLA